MIGIQTYMDMIGDSWIRYCEDCSLQSWFTSDEVHFVDNLRQLKKQTIEEAVGDDISAPKAVVFTKLKKPELFVPGIIVSEANALFEREIKREILSATPYRLSEFQLRFNSSPHNHLNYLMLTNGSYRKDAISDAEQVRLRNFADDCIDLAILFANPDFRKVCDEFSQLPKQVAQRYFNDLNLRGGKNE